MKPLPYLFPDNTLSIILNQKFMSKHSHLISLGAIKGIKSIVNRQIRWNTIVPLANNTISKYGRRRT